MLVRLHTRLNMLAAKDSKPVTSGERETTTTESEKSSTTSTPQPSGLGELAATATAPAGRGQGAVQQVQVGPLLEPTSRKCPEKGPTEGHRLHRLQDQ